MPPYGNSGIPVALVKARQVPSCETAKTKFCVWCALGRDAEAKIGLLNISWGYGLSDDELILFWPNRGWDGNPQHRTWRVQEFSQKSEAEVARIFDEIADYVHLIHTSRKLPHAPENDA